MKLRTESVDIVLLVKYYLNFIFSCWEGWGEEARKKLYVTKRGYQIKRYRPLHTPYVVKIGVKMLNFSVTYLLNYP